MNTIKLTILKNHNSCRKGRLIVSWFVKQEAGIAENVIINKSILFFSMRKYWKNIESLKNIEEVNKSEKEADNENSLLDLLNGNHKDMPASRRNFLKLCGFSFAVSALSSCRSKISKAVPYVIAPEEITPGEALFYASSYINGTDYCSIIVKNRDGRPIKIEGNPESTVSMGGTSARVQASVLDLYDGNRFHGPLKEGTSSDWETIDKEIMSRLGDIAARKGTIILLTPTIYSPSAEAVISGFLKRFGGSEWVQYDAISSSALLEANKISFGIQAIPDYRFDKASLVLSFGADFLGTWLSPVEYTKQFSSLRKPEGEMNCLIQFESNLSLTGSNADTRIQIKPSQEYSILLNIYKEILNAIEHKAIDVPASPVNVVEISEKLLSSRGRSLVISGSNVKDIQLIVNEINRLLGNIGSTVLFSSFLRTHAAIDSDMEKLISRMQKGEVDAMLIWNVNPAYTWYGRDAFSEGLKKVGLTVSLSGSPDETNRLMQYICPDNHYLESWNDAEPKKGSFSLGQPVIGRIFDTRQMTDSLLKWSGSEIAYYDFIKSYWSENLMKRQTKYSDQEVFFDNVLQKGVFEPGISQKITGEEISASRFSPKPASTESISGEGKIEIVLYETIALGEGRQANNPWLQELPDPVTRICWDNYASISPLQAREYDLHDCEIINIGGIDLPVHIQPGQAYGTIGVALGYGRSFCGPVGTGTGADAWPLLHSENNNIAYRTRIEDIIKTGKTTLFSQTQTHHSMEGRALVRQAGLKEFRENPVAGNEMHSEIVSHNESLYKEREYPHHHWGMAIDLSKCTGCSNCVIACQAENNIPVVGRDEVHRVHEMHWLRIDRYYTGPEEDPEVVFQPVLCQHCKNAPCENVCPVAATTHSSEGLNQMIYNRCFGTRYCNNNCPYKVRRFNWFNYTAAGTLKGNLRDYAGMTSDLRRMVLNPDVTVRSQGVIEKCSFCVQRIQLAKRNAKIGNRALRENEIQTACSQSCPANAIVFGDMNDKDSELNKLINSGRRYNLLEELFTMPSVNYLTKIKNKLV
jgi:Fe-S-cluster-containing dehydrogenase component/anaerobic selenocysteine-containing dehydrogenase